MSTNFDLLYNLQHYFPFLRFGNAVVIQHHPNIVTSSDLGLAVSCQYDLSNMTVANELDLKVVDPEPGDGPGLTHEVVVDSPSVAMRITVSFSTLRVLHIYKF
jgi:hypothetical protein